MKKTSRVYQKSHRSFQWKKVSSPCFFLFKKTLYKGLRKTRTGFPCKKGFCAMGFLKTLQQGFSEKPNRVHSSPHVRKPFKNPLKTFQVYCMYKCRESDRREPVLVVAKSGFSNPLKIVELYSPCQTNDPLRDVRSDVDFVMTPRTFSHQYYNCHNITAIKRTRGRKIRPQLREDCNKLLQESLPRNNAKNFKKRLTTKCEISSKSSDFNQNNLLTTR